MYTSEIIWLISWPIIIWFSYKMARLALKQFEKKEQTDETVTD